MAISPKFAKGRRQNNVTTYCQRLKDKEEPYCAPLAVNLLMSAQVKEASKKYRFPESWRAARLVHTLSKTAPAIMPSVKPIA